MAEDAFDDADLPPLGREERSRLGNATDVVRKMLVAGVGALFMTEEGIRSMVKELKLPKEALGFVLGQAEKTKGEVVRVVGQELRNFLASAKVREDLLQMLQQMTFEVKAEIKVKPRAEGSSQLFEPTITAKVERPEKPQHPKKPRRKKAPKA